MTHDTRRDAALLAAMTAGALALRLARIGDESYWYDELLSVLQTQGSVRDLLDELVRSDVHPPLYPLLLWLWTHAFGFSETATRALSALFGALAVPATWLFVRALDGRRVARIAAGFVALSPFALYYAQETRSYALNLTLALLAGWRLTRLCAAPDSRRALALYGLVALPTAYAHVYGLFVLAAHGVYVLAYEPALRRRFVLVSALVALGFAPWAPFFLRQVARVEHHFWIAPITLRSPLTWFWTWGGFSLATACVTLALVARGASLQPPPDAPRALRRPGALLALLVAFPAAVPVAISLVSQPIFHPKYAISILGPIALWSARALVALPSQRLRASLITAVMLMWAVALHFRIYSTVTKEQWREAAADARRASLAGDTVLADADTARCLRWYLRDVPVVPIAVDADLAALERPDGPRRVMFVQIHPDHSEREPAADRRWRRCGEINHTYARAVCYTLPPR